MPEVDKASQTARPDDVQHWYDDPVGFSRDVFGIEPWELEEPTGRSSQADVLRDVAKSHFVTCRAGQKTGKSLGIALLAFWFTTTRGPGARVILTSPSFTQVRKVLWREVRRLGVLAKEAAARLHDGTVVPTVPIDIPTVALDPSTGIEWEDGREIIGISTNTIERLGGFSGSHMLIIIDEASGYPDEYFHAMLGNTAGGAEDDTAAEAKIVKFGNPTQTSGHFFNDFRSDGHVSCHHISSEDSPNVRAGRVVVPGLATQHYLNKLLSECNGDRDNTLYMVRARGDFPQQGTNAVIPLVLVEAAQAEWAEAGGELYSANTGRLFVGVDVARFGDDDSAVACRHGKHVYPLRVESKLNEEAVAKAVLDECRRYHIRGQERPLVKVDANGVGAGVISVLRQHKDVNGETIVEIVPVDSAETANDPDQYRNRRSELWFAMSDWLQEGGQIPSDDRLAAELVAPKYSFDNQARRVVEPKRDFKKRLGRSPDRADAVALCIYTPSKASGFTAAAGDETEYRWGPYTGRGFG